MRIDRALSRKAAQRCRARAGECYVNAFHAWMLPELWDATYVEGWAVILDRIPIEHGWLEMGGKIIDPSMWDAEYEVAYFPGLRFDHPAFLKAIEGGLRPNTLPLFGHHPYRSEALLPFREAYAAANRYCKPNGDEANG